MLARSLRTHHPESSLEVLVVDDPEGLFDPAHEEFRVRFLDELALPRPREMTFRCGILELCTAVKPLFLRLLLGEGVPYRIVEVTRDAGPYRRGEAWAEPDVEAAATLLRSVFLDREGARAVAERGRADVEARLSPEAIGTAMAARLRHLGGNGASASGRGLSQPTNVAS